MSGVGVYIFGMTGLACGKYAPHFVVGIKPIGNARCGRVGNPVGVAFRAW
jgi:hypothetical protein